MAIEVLYIEDELKDVVNRVNAKLTTSFKFFYGEDEHVIKIMKDMKAVGSAWNPLIAIEGPVAITENAGGYGVATIRRIVIAAITDPSKNLDRRKETVIKPVIEPFYKEFINQISKRKSDNSFSSFAVLGDKINGTYQIRYGTQTAAQGFAEYIDGIEIIGMELTLKQDCYKN